MVVILNNTQTGGKIVYLIENINKILQGKKYKLPKPNNVEKQTLTKFQGEYQIKKNTNQ